MISDRKFKLFLDPELSIKYGVNHAIENPKLSAAWITYSLFFDHIISLIGDDNYLPPELVNLRSYPFDTLKIISHILGDITQIDEIRMRSVSYCSARDIIYLPIEYMTQSEGFINFVGSEVPDALEFIKKSIFTIDVLNLIILNSLPKDFQISISNTSEIVKFKKTSQYKILQNGVAAIVNAYSGNYKLTDPIKSKILYSLSCNYTKILDILNFNEIKSFDFKSILSDSISTLAGQFIPLLPLSTLQEIFELIKRRNTIQSDSDLLFSLSILIAQKTIIKNIIPLTECNCAACQLTNIEIDNIDPREVDDFIFTISKNFCAHHNLKYLMIRSSHHLIGKPLLRLLIS